MIVVNFSTNKFQKGQDRLKKSLFGNLLTYNKYDQINSPHHNDSPYEFKIHAIRKAFELDPVVLWADASMILNGDLSKIETIIKNEGYYMEEAGHYVGRWCNDFARRYFDLSIEEAQQGPGGLTMFSAGLLGLNRESEEAMSFFSQWEQSALAGCFKGSWIDHRHDMTCASIIAQRMGLKYQRGCSHLCYVGPGYNEPNNEAVFYCQGLA